MTVTPAQPLCDSGWTYIPAVSRCYRHSGSLKMTYDKAVQECDRIGGIIAMPKTKELQNAMVSILSDEEYWIGLERKGGAGHVDHWADGTDLIYDHICPCDYREDAQCAAYRTLGDNNGGWHYWADRKCSHKERFVCEKTVSFSTCDPLPLPPNLAPEDCEVVLPSNAVHTGPYPLGTTVAMNNWYMLPPSTQTFTCANFTWVLSSELQLGN
ncbi:layilin-like [Lingula anatina]|uniref:Layilin-like n=1 Tax=Lingula anatina TaxID=7574 RepID=A0A1S3IBC8_LINAN|nr:layilin-like [Lingula anatina]|eukprot:XP_013395473.1 layilin-like [Lingula anatina]